MSRTETQGGLSLLAFYSEEVNHGMHRAMIESMKNKSVAKRIMLCIDRKKQGSEFLLTALEEHPFELSVTDTYCHAVEEIILSSFDRYLIDMDLGVSDSISGNGLIAMIRSINPPAWIVAMSGRNGLDQERMIRSQGINFLLKFPIEKEEVDELVNAMRDENDSVKYHGGIS
jgi:DNA-binding NtrC family response regulator